MYGTHSLRREGVPLELQAAFWPCSAAAFTPAAPLAPQEQLSPAAGITSGRRAAIRGFPWEAKGGHGGGAGKAGPLRRRVQEAECMGHASAPLGFVLHAGLPGSLPG